MKIVQTKTFLKQLKKIKDKQTKKRIAKHIRKIVENPEIGDFLHYEKGVRKMYVKPYRLLYIWKDNTLAFLDFDHRKNIYREKKWKKDLDYDK